MTAPALKGSHSILEKRTLEIEEEIEILKSLKDDNKKLKEI